MAVSTTKDCGADTLVIGRDRPGVQPVPLLPDGGNLSGTTPIGRTRDGRDILATTYFQQLVNQNRRDNLSEAEFTRGLEARIEVIDSGGGIIETLTGRIDLNEQAIVTEETVRVARDLEIEARIETDELNLAGEIANRQSAILDLDGRKVELDDFTILSGRVTVAEGDVDQVAIDLSTEITNRQQAILDAETARGLIETTLTNRIDTTDGNVAQEVIDRIAADASLDQARITLETTVTNRLDTTDGNVTQEIADRIAADATESSARATLELTLAQDISDNRTDILQEVTDRTDAFADLDGRKAEVTVTDSINQTLADVDGQGTTLVQHVSQINQIVGDLSSGTASNADIAIINSRLDNVQMGITLEAFANTTTQTLVDLNNNKAEVTVTDDLGVRLTTAETDITTAEGDIVTLQGDLGTVQTDLGTAEGNITVLQGGLSDAVGDITTLQGDVGTLQGDVTTARTDITNVTQRVTTAEGNITTNANNIGDLQTGKVDLSVVQTLTGRVDTAETNITGIDGRVQTAEGQLVTIDGDITAIEGEIVIIQGDIDAVEGRATTLEGDVSTAQTNILNLQTGKVDQSTFNTLEGRVTDTETEITGIDGRVVVAEGDILALEGNVTNVSNRTTILEGDVSTAETNILNLQTGKADASTVTILGNRVGQTEIDIGSLTGDVVSIDNDLSVISSRLGNINASGIDLETFYGDTVQAVSELSTGKASVQSVDELSAELTAFETRGSNFLVIFDDLSVGGDAAAVSATLTGSALGQANTITIRNEAAVARDTTGFTNGFYVRVPRDIALSFSGRRIRIDVLAAPADSDPASGFSLAYSTSDNGNSGQLARTLSAGWNIYTFYYAVPSAVAGGDDWVGIYADGLQDEGVRVARLTVGLALESEDPQLLSLAADIETVSDATVDLQAGKADASVVTELSARAFSTFANVLPSKAALRDEFVHQLTAGPPETAAPHEGSVASDGDLGDVLVVSWQNAGQKILTRGTVPLNANATYRVTGRWEAATLPPDGSARMEAICAALDQNGAFVGARFSGAIIGMTSAPAIYETTWTFGAGGDTSFPTSGTQLRLGFQFRDTETGPMTIRWQTVKVEDVSREVTINASLETIQQAVSNLEDNSATVSDITQLDLDLTTEYRLYADQAEADAVAAAGGLANTAEANAVAAAGTLDTALQNLLQAYADGAANQAEIDAVATAVVADGQLEDRLEIYADNVGAGEAASRGQALTALESSLTINYETYADQAEADARSFAQGAANTAQSNAQGFAQGAANTAQGNAETYADGAATQARNDAQSFASTIVAQASDDLQTDVELALGGTLSALASSNQNLVAQIGDLSAEVSFKAEASVVQGIEQSLAASAGIIVDANGVFAAVELFSNGVQSAVKISADDVIVGTLNVDLLIADEAIIGGKLAPNSVSEPYTATQGAPVVGGPVFTTGFVTCTVPNTVLNDLLIVTIHVLYGDRQVRCRVEYENDTAVPLFFEVPNLPSATGDRWMVRSFRVAAKAGTTRIVLRPGSDTDERWYYGKITVDHIKR